MLSDARLKILVSDQILVQMGLPTLGLALGPKDVLDLVFAAIAASGTGLALSRMAATLAKIADAITIPASKANGYKALHARDCRHAQDLPFLRRGVCLQGLK